MRYTLIIEDDSTSQIPAMIRLRRCLKILLRSLGLRCISIEPVPEPGPQDGER